MNQVDTERVMPDFFEHFEYRRFMGYNIQGCGEAEGKDNYNIYWRYHRSKHVPVFSCSRQNLNYIEFIVCMKTAYDTNNCATQQRN